ncbi:unnamed protein product [Lactuca saligna]|uniref:Uncharacterized protein n=1 Tax=Lactuca saligna TaxID=75948 RepID=A0AA35ZED3_LACSI|nr:unnamed protein product [Lactuca saligna]
MKALTMSKDVLIVHLSKAISTDLYNKTKDVISIEVSNHKTLIRKPNFSKLLVIIMPEVSVDPESIPATYLIEMFFQMGYMGIFHYSQNLGNPSYLRCGMDYSPFYSKACQKGFQVLTVQASCSTTRSMGYTMASTSTMGLLLGLNSFKAPVPLHDTHKFLIPASARLLLRDP